MSACHRRRQFSSSLTTLDVDVRTAIRRLERKPESARLRDVLNRVLAERNETRRLVAVHEAECAVCAGAES